MQSHEIKPKIKHQSAKRVGRGGKRGTTSGKGQKGQKSRAGHRIRPATRDTLQRIPKLKGVKNKPLKSAAVAVNFSDIEKKIKDSVITRQSLIEAGIVKKSQSRIKILGNGELSRAITTKGLEVSKSAQAKIEAKGGKVE